MDYKFYWPEMYDNYFYHDELESKYALRTSYIYYVRERDTNVHMTLIRSALNIKNKVIVI